ncbi:MAG: hypothetical protein IT259_12040, partial [Saprospiraceae bacterium]|nr:hypothetical protein [Saprospiraceae bacterium]
MKKLSTPLSLAGVFVLLALLFGACGKEKNTGLTKEVADFDYSVVFQWNDLFLQIERHAAGYRPGPAPRA